MVNIVLDENYNVIYRFIIYEVDNLWYLRTL